MCVLQAHICRSSWARRLKDRSPSMVDFGVVQLPRADTVSAAARGPPPPGSLMLYSHDVRPDASRPRHSSRASVVDRGKRPCKTLTMLDIPRLGSASALLVRL